MDPFIYKVQHNFGLIAIFYYFYKKKSPFELNIFMVKDNKQ